MQTIKLYIRPETPESEELARAETERYCWARNRYIQHARKWVGTKARKRADGTVVPSKPARIRDDNLLAEFRTEAETLRGQQRTGRKPSERSRYVASGLRPGKRGADSREFLIATPTTDKHRAALAKKLTDLSERYESVECVESGLGRTDCQELAARESREIYAEFVAMGGFHGTHRLAQEAAAKASRTIRDTAEGRAAMHAPDIKWEWDPECPTRRTKYFRYHSTRWSIKRQDIPYVDSIKGAIKQAYVQRTRVSSAESRNPKYRWFLYLVIDQDSAPHAIAHNRSAAGLDLCWRQQDDGATLRIAYVASQHGHEPITMPASAYKQLQHAKSIKGFVDREANLLRAEYGLPAQTSHRTLLERCGLDHPVGKRLVHLAEYAHHEGRHALDVRDAHYLSEVHRLLAAHHTIYIEKIKGTGYLVQTPTKIRDHVEDVSESRALAGKARDQRQAAAPFTFLRLLQREAPKFNTQVIERDPAFTSRICTCGHDMGPGSQLWRRCQECGQRWDVDHLAALNLSRPEPLQDASAEVTPNPLAPLDPA
jgi:hypothetical protein